MEVAFQTERLRNICLNLQAAEETLGNELARVLRRIIADLRAADVLADAPLLVSNSDSANEEWGDVMQIHEDLTVKFVSNHQKKGYSAFSKDGRPQIRRIKIVEIVTHG